MLDFVNISIQPDSYHKHSQKLHLHPLTVHKEVIKILFWWVLQKKLLM